MSVHLLHFEKALMGLLVCVCVCALLRNILPPASLLRRAEPRAMGRAGRQERLSALLAAQMFVFRL